MARRWVRIGGGLAIVGVLLVVGVVRAARYSVVASSVSAVSKQVNEKLRAYYSKHGRYPTSLAELQLDLAAADHATDETLRWIRYQSNGVSFTYAEVGPDEWHRRVWWCYGPEQCGFADLQ